MNKSYSGSLKLSFKLSFVLLRGSDWGYDQVYARVTDRLSSLPGGRYNNLGFRLVRGPSLLELLIREDSHEQQ